MDDSFLAQLLNDVTRARESTFGVHEDNRAPQEDLRALVRAWISERGAPELLPYPHELMERIMARIRRQIETIEEDTARMDAGTSFGLVVLQTELERCKFIVRSLLRARISKIDAHLLHVLATHDPAILPGTQSQDSQVPSLGGNLLSDSEASYARTHAALLERHYTASFLSSFPQKLRRLDDRAGGGGVGMVEGPDLDKAVFVRCLGARRLVHETRRRAQMEDVVREDEEMDDGGGTWEEYGPVEVACGFTATDRDDDEARAVEGERRVQMQRGDVWIVRWRGVRQAVARGEVELL